MIKLRMIKLFLIGAGGLLISCHLESNSSDLDKVINEVKDSQEVILKKITSLEKSINNLALASKNNPVDNNKKQPPKADPNKVYNIPIGDSFTKGPEDAAVTIIEWSDFQ